MGSQVNAAASAAAGFMVQGDALIVQQALPSTVSSQPPSQSTLAEQPTCTPVANASASQPEHQASSNGLPHIDSGDSKHRNLLLATPSRRKPPSLPATTAASTSTAAEELSSIPRAEAPAQADVFGTLQGELLGHILKQVSWTGKEAITLSAVCRWALPMPGHIAWYQVLARFYVHIPNAHGSVPSVMHSDISLQAEMDFVDCMSVLSFTMYTLYAYAFSTQVSCLCRSWRIGMCADKSFLTAVRVRLDPKMPYSITQMCECCRGASEIMRNRRHPHQPLPSVIIKVHSMA